jgi:hypothetical protein
MMRSALVLVSTVLFGAAPVVVVNAAGDAPKRATAADTNKHPCHDDIQKFCKDVQLAGGRIQQCLTRHEAELSKACRDSRQQAKARVDKFLKACDPDIKKFCEEVQPGGGRMTRCLKAKESQLTAACRAEFQTGRKAANSSEQ